MATDNPNKKKADAKRISQQPHEQAYQSSHKISYEEKTITINMDLVKNLFR